MQFERGVGKESGTPVEAGMASNRKIMTNRLNAKRSTGPKTEAGRARSSRNARQHGLSRLNLEDNAGSDAAAGAITVSFAQPQDASTVHDLVRASIWLAHIRDVRHGMLAALLDCPNPKQLKRLTGLERYERSARAAQRRVLRRWLNAE
ncbi:hypothetical protein JQ599_27565 [Bradyrhizobium diazoefficiens]|nr:hypothetical protein [Bradyrhizobium diazoefficiens]MBR0703693.1 hypothetical protein [Bradyrhizobium diazoefficiens]MBR0772449.1 hypothetical protein [Bradyrhizobium diazoefficiens]